MALPRQAALRATRQVSRNSQRRFASHGSHNHGHGHGDSANEAIGPGFIATVAILPVSYILYQSVHAGDSTEEPWATRMLHKLDHWQDEYSDRNDLHAKLSEQAASDRVFFMNTGTAPEKRAFKVRNIESLNSGSPYNVSAGWGGINLEKVIAHQNKENEETEQRNIERLKRKLSEEPTE